MNEDRVEPGDVLPASVIICSRNRAAMLWDSVRSVLDGDRVPDEIVVVDQSATAHRALQSLGVVRGCSVTYIHSTSPGVSRARNLGMRRARNDVVVLLDDDILVEHDWLRRLLEGLRAGDARTVATGRVLPAPPEGDAAAVPAAALFTFPEPAVYRGRQPREVVPGANVALHRQFALGIGGFDERLGPGTRFAAADDNDMALRLLDAGAEVRHLPDAVVLHRAWRGAGGRARQRWHYGRGKGAFYGKHLRAGDAYVAGRLGRDLATRVRRACSAAGRSPRTTVAEALSLAGIASGLVEWLVRERTRSVPRPHRRPRSGARP